MAINRSKNKVTEETTQETSETPAQYETETQESSSVAGESDATEAAPAPRRRGPQKGYKKGPMKTEGLKWSEEQDLALFALLKESNGRGAVKTPESVASALSEDEGLFPQGVKPFDVASHVRSFRRAAGERTPDWMVLGERPKVSLNLHLLEE